MTGARDDDKDRPLEPTDQDGDVHADAPATIAAAEPRRDVDGSRVALPSELVRYALDAGRGVDMSQANVQRPLVMALSDYVALLHTPLVRLTLSRNALGPTGAQLLGKALVTNNTLQFLELDSCELIGSAYRPQHSGILALAKGFESVRSTLRFVNLADNSLQPEGCRVVLGALSFHRTLTALDLSSNLLGVFNDTAGVLALSYAIRYAKQLCWLAINDNPLPTASWKILQTSLTSHATLTSLSAVRCNISIEQLRPKSRASTLTHLQC